jgi:DNA-nicking Smr family endonuclease
MSRKREPSDEERALFKDALKDTQPLKDVKPRARAKTGVPRAKLRAETPRDPEHIVVPFAAQPSGVDGGTQARLDRGTLDPQARIDLHGMTETAAHRALATFIRGAASRGHRLVLVVTGKGKQAADPHEAFDLELVQRRRGVLRSMTPRWLAEPELSGFVADIRPAHRRHGGDGALYVYLRKVKR